jgi:4'-phosphopantetheinyl transferase EntD
VKQIISERPKIIIVDHNFDCSNSIHLPIVQNDLVHCKSEKRRNEIIYTRSLIHQELGISKLLKDSIGRPTLDKGDVSISHSGAYYGIAYDETKNIGLDIEVISDKPRRIKQKFQNENELDFDISDIELTRLWTLKEAVYKYLARAGVLFAEQIWIQKNDDHYTAEYKVDGKIIEKISLKSTEIGNCIVSFTF